eukprot:TRINITY_DN263_c1_g1_i11.p1 TRINITY_DN263_c1_g1~~TRINITY_DN263_c1_g1_i11.p1  ORF type:complete len:259 (-),score=94.93 TRINITY_DN263_c1_g1_i11:124-813(-)
MEKKTAADDASASLGESSSTETDGGDAPASANSSQAPPLLAPEKVNELISTAKQSQEQPPQHPQPQVQLLPQSSPPQQPQPPQLQPQPPQLQQPPRQQQPPVSPAAQPLLPPQQQKEVQLLQRRVEELTVQTTELSVRLQKRETCETQQGTALRRLQMRAARMEKALSYKDHYIALLQQQLQAGATGARILLQQQNLQHIATQSVGGFHPLQQQAGGATGGLQCTHSNV